MMPPAGWRRVAIRELYQGLYDGPHATPPVSDDGPVFLGIGNITVDGHLDLGNVRHIDEADFATWTKRITPQPGDIVFTYEATLNRYAIIPRGFRGCLGRRLALIRPNVDVIDVRFLLYFFFSRDWRETIEANKLAGATVERIPLTHFPDFPVNVPPLPTQRRISSILAGYDDLIENNTRRIAILEKMTGRLYEEWFVHFRFPGHNGEGPEDGLPAGWRCGPISDLYEDLYDGPHATPKPSSEGPIFLGIGNLTESGRLDLTDVRLIAEEDFPAWTKRVCPQPGDIVFTYEATLNRYAIIPRGFRGCLGRRLALIRANPTKSSNLFLYCLFFSPDWRATVAENTLSGATVDRIPLSKFPQFPVTIPSLDLIMRFDEAVRPMFAQMQVLNQMNANLRAQRDLLLPKLVSGEIDVSQAEELAQEAAA